MKDIERAVVFVDTGGKEEKIDVMFNPSDYVIESGNNYSWIQVPGLQSPIAQYISGENQTLKMNLFFDTYATDKLEDEKEDVRNHTKKIYGLLDIKSELHTPPTCRFVWGSLNFKGIVESVSQQFTMFVKTGIPVRATLSVTFRSVQTIEEQLKHTPRESPDRTKQRIVKQNDQLWMLAVQEYDDPGKWREIAQENNIYNPRFLKSGTQIRVPSID